MKKLMLVGLLLVLLVALCSCNYTIIDTTYHFNYAQIVLPDGSFVQGVVQSWTDYAGDQIQIRIDGKTYLTHAENVVLISD